MKSSKIIQAALTAAIFTALATASASAATFTVINASSGEPSIFSTLDAIYGAGNYERISDDADDVWTSVNIIGVTAISKYSAATQQLGVCEICDGSDNFPFGSSVTLDGIFTIGLFDGVFTFTGPSFRWYDAAAGHPQVATVYSDSSLNASGNDHMVTFAIKDRPAVFVLGFEDLLTNSDRDFNDFMVEVRFAQPNDDVSAVPEPTSVVLFGGALLALGLVRRSRRPRV